MIKYVKNNMEYFKFIESKKDTYNIKVVKPLKNRIKIEYEKKS